MIRVCVFENDSDRCKACGRKGAALPDGSMSVRNCIPGLGDRVAAGLAAFGITKERVSAVIGDCGCEQRQKALNELGYKLGIGVTTEPHSG